MDSVLILDALISAEFELTVSAGLIATDRPDLPLSANTSWIIDPAETLTKLRLAIKSLSDTCSGS